jgi:hypothetical protein
MGYVSLRNRVLCIEELRSPGRNRERCPEVKAFAAADNSHDPALNMGATPILLVFSAIDSPALIYARRR